MTSLPKRRIVFDDVMVANNGDRLDDLEFGYETVTVEGREYISFGNGFFNLSGPFLRDPAVLLLGWFRSTAAFDYVFAPPGSPKPPRDHWEFDFPPPEVIGVTQETSDYYPVKGFEGRSTRGLSGGSSDNMDRPYNPYRIMSSTYADYWFASDDAFIDCYYFLGVYWHNTGANWVPTGRTHASKPLPKAHYTPV
jgi:hypothetical protein